VKRSTLWTIAGVVFALVAFVTATVFITIHEVAKLPARTIAASADALTEIAQAFRQGTVEIRFSNYASEVSGSQFFQFATLNQIEVFERLDSATVLWGTVALPDIVVEITAPVEYTYYVDLNGEWSFALRDGIVEVEVPAIEHNEPAIDASKIDFRVRQDSLVRNTDEAMEKLRAVLTDLARERARDNVELVREVGRRRVEQFIRTWLGSEFPDSERLRIDVRFAGEDPPPSSRLQIEGE